jgi:hypothetical protein
MTHKGRWKTGLVLCAALAVGIGAGMLLQSSMDTDNAKKLATTAQAERERARDTAAARESHLNDIIEQERKRHDEQARARDTHLAAFTSRTVRMRNELTAYLSDSRASADACRANAAGIAEAVGALIDSVGEGAGLLEASAVENRRLAAENRDLAERVRGWQQRYVNGRVQQITVTAKKP